MTNSVAIDLGWLRQHEDGRQRLDDLSQAKRLKREERQPIFNQLLQTLPQTGLTDALLFLELLVVHDELTVDATAIERMKLKLPLPFIKEHTPSKEVYLAAARRARDFRTKLRDLAQEPGPMKDLYEQVSDPGPGVFWSSDDKRFHDSLKTDDLEVAIEAAFQDSNDTVGRVFFYLEFGRAMGHTLLVSKNKRVWMDIIGEQIQRSVHERLAGKMDAQVIDGFWTEQPLQPPPVAQLILRRAILDGVRPLDAALEIRESREATDYRRLLGELRAADQSGDRAARLQAQRQITELDKLAMLWRERSDPEAGILWKPRTFKFSALVPDWIDWIGGPAVKAITSLTKASGVGEAELKDRILTRPPGYLAFVSSWYDKKVPARSN